MKTDAPPSVDSIDHSLLTIGTKIDEPPIDNSLLTADMKTDAPPIDNLPLTADMKTDAPPIDNSPLTADTKTDAPPTVDSIDRSLFTAGMKTDAPPIIDSIDHSLLTGGLASVTDRYYEHRYVRKIQGVDVQQRVSFHTNKIVMLSLADDHPVIKEKLTVKKVNFVNDKGIDRTQNAASGKGKRGAQELFPKAVICYVETDDDTRYPVYSCVKGKLLEVNEALINTPQLIVDRPVSDGYIALILPFLKKYAETKESTLTKDDYYLVNKNDS